MQAFSQVLNGWGNFTPCPSRVFRPEWARDAIDLVNGSTEPTWIARGLSRSYGDSALNDRGGTLLVQRMNQLISFEPTTGTLSCEAGVSLEDLLHIFLARGWFPPVTPGTKHVTIGGAIAADIHGKNHHVDGTFSRFVESLDLLTGEGRVLTCSPSENADCFWATVGGMGLTGVILRARLRLSPVESAYLDVEYRKAPSLDKAIELLERDQGYRYSVAWIDCLASGKSLGRSVVMLGNHAPAATLPGPLKPRPLHLPVKRKKSVPFNLPGFVLNPATIRAFNLLYYSSHRDGRKTVDYDSFFYPLDGIRNWNRMYGKRGFVQYQALIPTEASPRGIIRLLEEVSASKMASFLAVLKRTGAGGGGLLSFPRPGYTLALDIPNGRRLRELIDRLDRIVLEHGGRLYLAKDATTSPEAFAAMYDRLEEFRRVKARLDPGGRFSSVQARRLKIVGDP